MTTTTDDLTSRYQKMSDTRRPGVSCASRERAPAFKLMPGPLVYLSLATRRTFD